jgi:hypothetical protein
LEEQNVSNKETKPQKTKIEQIKDELSLYPDLQSAKKAIPNLAKKYGVTRTLVYKALKQISFPEPIKAEEPTVKIPEVKPEPLPEIPVEAVELKPEELKPEEVKVEEAKKEMPITSDKLSWMFKLLFEKIGNALNYPDFALTQNEADKLAEAWLPVLNQHLPQALQDPTTWCALTTIIILAPRILGYISFKRKTKQASKEVKVEETKTETPTEATPTETPNTTPAETETPKKPAFLEQL